MRPSADPGDLRSGEPKLLDRLLSVFTDIRVGEGGLALVMMLNVFLLLVCYYVIKPVREALILSGSGAEVKSYATTVMVIALLLLVPAFAKLASRVNRTMLLTGVTVFFVLNLLLFYGMAQTRMPYLDVVFFIWVGIFGVMIVAQFWSLANDIYLPEEGRRLFPIIAFGAVMGAIVGATVADSLIDPKKADQGAINRLLLLAAGILALCAVLTWLIARRPKVARVRPEDQSVTHNGLLAHDGAFRLVFGERYLLLIALLILVSNFVITNGEYILGSTVQRAAHQISNVTATGLPPAEFQKQFIGSYYAGFFKWVNWITALMQLFLVSRVLKWLGVRIVLFVLPFIALGGYALFAFAPVLSIIRGVMIMEYSTDYSLQNTARQALFLTTSREAKYKAKQVTDAFFWRVGDVLSSGMVFLSTRLALAPVHFAEINLVLVVLWILIVWGIVREHRKLSREATESSPVRDPTVSAPSPF